MPISRAIARSVTAGSPSSRSSRRATSLISTRVACRSRSRRVGLSLDEPPCQRNPLTGKRRTQSLRCSQISASHRLASIRARVPREQDETAMSKGPAMFEGLGRFTYRRRRWVLAAAGAWWSLSRCPGGSACSAPCPAAASTTRTRSTPGPTSSSTDAFGARRRRRRGALHQPDGTVDDPAFRAAVSVDHRRPAGGARSRAGDVLVDGLGRRSCRRPPGPRTPSSAGGRRRRCTGRQLRARSRTSWPPPG